MRLPVLNELPATKDVTEEFKGYNHNERNAAGEWYDEKNMSTDYYPLSSPRKKRSLQQTAKEIEKTIGGHTYRTTKTHAALYTDSRLIKLQTLKKNDNEIGCWFIDDGEFVMKRTYVDWWFYEISGGASNQQPSGKYLPFIQFVIRYNPPTITNGNTLSITFYKDSTREKEHKKQTLINCQAGTQSETNYYTLTGYVDTEYSTSIGAVLAANAIVSSIGDNKWATHYDVTAEESHISDLETEAALFNASDKHNLTRMGSYIFDAPEGVVYESANKTDDLPVFKVAENFYLNGYVAHAKTVVKDDSEEFPYKVMTYHNPEISTYADGDYRYADGAVQQYLAENALWVNVPTQIVVFVANMTGTFGNLRKGDAIYMGYGKPSVHSKDLSSIKDKTTTIIDKGTVAAGDSILGTTVTGDTDYIVVEGFITFSYEATNPTTQVTFTDYVSSALATRFLRKMPDISNLVCESQNRIWACDKNGHEIYASALGNPYNFYDYSGLATDSYAVNVGTEGKWTGCVNYLGQPLFFKENALHIISGSYPTNQGTLDGGSYAVTTITDFKGVERGSEKSFAIINNILYYKSAEGIVAYDGSSTALVSTALGKKRYKNAVAGSYESKYYVSMQDENNVWHMFSYDTKLGTWSREDNAHALQFIKVNNELLYCDVDNDNVYSVSDTDVLNLEDFETEGDVEWMCETGTIGYSYPNNKYISRFQVRMQLEDGARVSVYTQYNSDGVWHKVGDIENKGIKTHLLPIVPIRCDHMKIKFKGKGDAKIISLAKIIEEGGDV